MVDFSRKRTVLICKYLSVLLLSFFCTIGSAVFAVESDVFIPIVTSADDAEEHTTGATVGAVSLTSIDLEMVNDWNAAQLVALRFQDVSIPHGVTITSAFIQFSSRAKSSSTPAALTVQVEASDHAQALTAEDFNLSGRTRTATAVSWVVPHWLDANLRGVEQRTPDLTSLIQEVTNRSGWQLGNAMTFLVSGSETDCRNAWSYNGPGEAPALHIQWTSGTRPLVSVATSQPYATETPQTAGQFIISRGDDTSGDLSVAYTLSGTAVLGEDYTVSSSGSVTIPDGQSSFVVDVSVLSDNVNELEESIILTIDTDVSSYVIETAVAELSLTDEPILPAEGTGDGALMCLHDSGVPRQVVPAIDFSWGVGSPVESMPIDDFRVSFTGYIQPRYTEMYDIIVRADDRFYLYLNYKKLGSNWGVTPQGDYVYSMYMEAGRRYYFSLSYTDNTEDASVSLLWRSARQSEEVIPQSQLYSTTNRDEFKYTDGYNALSHDTTNGQYGLLGSYYPSTDTSTAPFMRYDAKIDWYWGDIWNVVDAPFYGFPENGFRVHWKGSVAPEFTEDYTLTLVYNDGVRLYLDDELVIDNWESHTKLRESSVQVSLVAGQSYDFRLEYWEYEKKAQVQLFWESASQPYQVIPQRHFKPAPLDLTIPQQSFVSPAYIEGGRPASNKPLRAESGNNELTIRWIGQNRFATNVPLDADSDVALSIFENNELVQTDSVTWTPTVLTGEACLAVRPGDSLLFESPIDGFIRREALDGSLSEEYPVSVGDRVALAFESHGRYRVTAVTASQFVMGARNIDVMDVSIRLPNAIEIGYDRTIIIPTVGNGSSSHIVATVDGSGEIQIVSQENGIGYKSIVLSAYDIGTAELTLRLDSANGPILAQQEINSFYLELPPIAEGMCIDNITRIGSTHIRIVPYVADIELRLNLRSSLTTFFGGVNDLLVNTSDQYSNIGDFGVGRYYDEELGMDVGLLMFDVEVPLYTKTTCFSVTPWQKDLYIGESDTIEYDWLPIGDHHHSNADIEFKDVTKLTIAGTHKKPISGQRYLDYTVCIGPVMPVDVQVCYRPDVTNRVHCVTIPAGEQKAHFTLRELQLYGSQSFKIWPLHKCVSYVPSALASEETGDMHSTWDRTLEEEEGGQLGLTTSYVITGDYVPSKVWEVEFAQDRAIASVTEERTVQLQVPITFDYGKIDPNEGVYDDFKFIHDNKCYPLVGFDVWADDGIIATKTLEIGPLEIFWNMMDSYTMYQNDWHIKGTYVASINLDASLLEDQEQVAVVFNNKRQGGAYLADPTDALVIEIQDPLKPVLTIADIAGNGVNKTGTLITTQEPKDDYNLLIPLHASVPAGPGNTYDYVINMYHKKVRGNIATANFDSTAVIRGTFTSGTDEYVLFKVPRDDDTFDDDYTFVISWVSLSNGSGGDAIAPVIGERSSLRYRVVDRDRFIFFEESSMTINESDGPIVVNVLSSISNDTTSNLLFSIEEDTNQSTVGWSPFSLTALSLSKEDNKTSFVIDPIDYIGRQQLVIRLLDNDFSHLHPYLPTELTITINSPIVDPMQFPEIEFAERKSLHQMVILDELIDDPNQADLNLVARAEASKNIHVDFAWNTPKPLIYNAVVYGQATWHTYTGEDYETEDVRSLVEVGSTASTFKMSEPMYDNTSSVSLVMVDDELGSRYTPQRATVGIERTHDILYNYVIDNVIIGFDNAYVTETGELQLEVFEDAGELGLKVVADSDAPRNHALFVNYEINVHGIDSALGQYDGNTVTGAHYSTAARKGQLQINPNETHVILPIALLDNAIYEGDKQFTIELSRAISGELVQERRLLSCIIRDRELPPPDIYIEFDDVTIAQFSEAEVDGAVVRQEVSLGLSLNIVDQPGGSDPRLVSTFVDYLITPGTAIAGIHYANEGLSGQIEFTKDETIGSIPIVLLNNAIYDASNLAPTFTVTLSNPQNGITQQSTISVQINEDELPPATVYFACHTSHIDVDEDAGTAAISIILDLQGAGPRYDAVSVDYIVGLPSDTALNGTHYSASQPTETTTITFEANPENPAAATREKTISVPLHGNGIYQGQNPFFTVHLSNPQGGFLANGRTQSVVTITDNEEQPTVVFVEPVPDNTSFNEGDTYTGTISLDTPLLETVTINIEPTLGITDFPSSNYTISPAQITYAAGQNGSRSFTVTTTNNGYYSLNEQLALELSTSGTIVGTHSNLLLTIQNTDAVPTISLDPVGASPIEGLDVVLVENDLTAGGPLAWQQVVRIHPLSKVPITVVARLTEENLAGYLAASAADYSVIADASTTISVTESDLLYHFSPNNTHRTIEIEATQNDGYEDFIETLSIELLDGASSITGSNDLPTIAADKICKIGIQDVGIAVEDRSFVTDEDTAIQHIAVNTLHNGPGELVLEISKQPENGTLLGGDFSDLTYTPNAQYYGDDSFTVTASLVQDGSVIATRTGTIFITVTSVLDPPILRDHNVVVPIDHKIGSLIMQLHAVDPDGSIDTYEITAGNDQGLFAMDDLGHLTTVATISGHEVHALTIEVTDNDGVKSTGIINITVIDAEAETLVKLPPFDEEYYLANKETYLGQSVPARVWQTAVASEETPVLLGLGRYYIVSYSPTYKKTLSVVGAPFAPVTFHVIGMSAALSDLVDYSTKSSITVEADENGSASVFFCPKQRGRFVVLVGSPKASGQVRYVLEVR